MLYAIWCPVFVTIVELCLFSSVICVGSLLVCSVLLKSTKLKY